MRIRYLTGWIVIMLVSGIPVLSQDIANETAHVDFFDDLYITPTYHAGFVLPEYKYFLYLIEDHVQSKGLNISKKTTGENDWEQIYKYPEYGISLFFSTLGNDKVFGHEIALYPFFNYHIFSRNRFSIDNQIGLGISYVTRKFDLQDNYQNIAVGSNLNIHFCLRLDFKYHLLKRYQLHTGLSFDHFSNGNLQEPNRGINYLTSYAGVGYRVGKSSHTRKHKLKPHERDFHLELTYAFGGKHTRAFQSTFFFTSSGTLELKWEPFRVLHVGIGTDLFFDSSTETEMQALNLTDYRKQYDFRSGIHVSQEIIYNKVSLIIQEGIYIFLTDNVNHQMMYNRGIVRYAISDHIMVSISMKSHLHILDYPELGLGFRF
jgi:hypothetical protein